MGHLLNLDAEGELGRGTLVRAAWLSKGGRMAAMTEAIKWFVGNIWFRKKQDEDGLGSAGSKNYGGGR